MVLKSFFSIFLFSSIMQTRALSPKSQSFSFLCCVFRSQFLGQGEVTFRTPCQKSVGASARVLWGQNRPDSDSSKGSGLFSRRTREGGPIYTLFSVVQMADLFLFLRYKEGVLMHACVRVSYTPCVCVSYTVRVCFPHIWVCIYTNSSCLQGVASLGVSHSLFSCFKRG